MAGKNSSITPGAPGSALSTHIPGAVGSVRSCNHVGPPAVCTSRTSRIGDCVASVRMSVMVESASQAAPSGVVPKSTNPSIFTSGTSFSVSCPETVYVPVGSISATVESGSGASGAT